MSKCCILVNITDGNRVNPRSMSYITQMNIKLSSLNVENENFEYTYTSWRRKKFRGPKKRGCYN